MPTIPYSPSHSVRRRMAPIALLFALSAPAAFARSSSQDRASFGSDITVQEGENAADVACAFCSVHLIGNVKGDVAVAFGSVTVEPGQTISGDIAILGGNLNLADDSHVGGDVAIAAGELSAAPTASIRGSRAIFPGRFWLIVPFAPLILLIGIIWLIVYIIRRNRYQFPMYPNGRRI